MERLIDRQRSLDEIAWEILERGVEALPIAQLEAMVATAARAGASSAALAVLEDDRQPAIARARAAGIAFRWIARLHDAAEEPEGDRCPDEMPPVSFTGVIPMV